MELCYANKKSKEEVFALANEVSKGKTIQVEQDMILKGDNFEVLSLLLNANMKGKIDLIYIDPPFSSQNDFIVTENRVSTISAPNDGIVAYSDKLNEDEYLEYIRERIILLYELLSEKGSFYFHIDTKIGHYVKIVLDEIFGRQNFINDITRKKSNPKNFHRKAYGNEKDVLLYYAKKKGNQIWNEIKQPYDLEELKEKYHKRDADGRMYNTVPIHAPGESKGETGKSWKGMLPPEGRHWRTSPKELTMLDEKGLIEWSSTGNPRLKKLADEHKGKKIQDIWLHYKDYVYPVYPTQKNLDMLKLIIEQSSNKNSIVLDAFAGSGTTLLAAKSLGRNFIGIDQEDFAIDVMKKRLDYNNKNSKIKFIDIKAI